MKIIITSDTHYGYSNKTHDILEDFYAKIEERRPDVIIHCGDWATTNQLQFRLAIEQIRKCLPEPRILTVAGNHDFWDGKVIDGKVKITPSSHKRIIENHRDIYARNNIRGLQSNTINCILGVDFTGFSGWYNTPIPKITNDKQWISETAMYDAWEFGNKEAKSAIKMTINKLDQPVCVTHFPPFTDNLKYKEMCNSFGFMEHLTKGFDYLFVGHSHQECDFMQNGCRVINCGSDYDKPKYKEIIIREELV